MKMNTLSLLVCLAMLFAGASACAVWDDIFGACSSQLSALSEEQELFFVVSPGISNDAACRALLQLEDCGQASSCPLSAKNEFGMFIIVPFADNLGCVA